jgi:hypothetical protein
LMVLVNPNSGFQQYEIELHSLSFVQVLPLIPVKCPVTSWIPAKITNRTNNLMIEANLNDPLCDSNLLYLL